MKIAFIRHGETNWNAEGRLQGSSDIPLNALGRQQAGDAVDALVGHRWEVIVSSPLSRARETAEIVADRLGIRLGKSYDLLAERDYGEAEGVTADDADARWPNGDYPGLESIDSVVARGTAALQEIAEEYAGQNVVAVCHGTIIRCSLAFFAGHPFDHILNGSVSTIEVLEGQWRVLSVNGVSLESQS